MRAFVQSLRRSVPTCALAISWSTPAVAEMSERLLRDALVGRMECLMLTRESLRPSSFVSNECLASSSSKAIDSAILLDASVDSVPGGGCLGSDSSKAL